MSTGLAKRLGLVTLLRLIFEQIEDPTSWAALSSTCRRAKMLGKSLLKWEEKYGCQLSPVMPSGKYLGSRIILYHDGVEYMTSSFRYMKFNGVYTIVNKDHGWKLHGWGYMNGSWYSSVAHLGNNDKVYLPKHGTNSDFVLTETKKVPAEVISELVGTPYVKLRLNSSKVIEHRLSVEGKYRERVLSQKKRYY